MRIVEEVNSVTVHQEETVIKVTESSEVYAVSTGGAGGEFRYVHDQQAASSHWIINHNLSCYPSVTVVDSGGSVNLANYQYVSVNRIDIFFSALTAGKAYLN